MGIPIDEEDCPVCEEFKDGWIFTYGDLVTLLLCFFILLFSMCKYEIEKFKSVAESFKPLPAGTPFMEEGNDSVVEQISKNVENTELGDSTNVTAESRGVVVSFSAQAFFEPESSELTADARKELQRFAQLLFLLPNPIQIEGHTDNVPVAFSDTFKSNWDLSAARAAAVADFLLTATNLEGGNVQIAGFADTRPLGTNDSPSGRSRNRRIEVIVDDN